MNKICYRCGKSDEGERISGLHSACFCHWFQVELPAPFSDIAMRSKEDISGVWDLATSSFFHGKFRKYSARLGNQSYILKVQQEDFPELPATEYLCNQLAQLFGLDVAEFYFILFQERMECFVSKNFMTQYSGSDLRHIYRYLARPEDYNCEYLLQVIERNVGTYDAIVRFINVCLFDAFIGNHDRHGRNLGLIEGGGKILLAPFYDNPSYLGMEIPQLLGAQHEPRGAIATFATREPVMKDYVKEWKRLGFVDEIALFAKKIVMSDVEKHIDSSYLSKPRKEAIKKLCSRRYKELIDAL